MNDEEMISQLEATGDYKVIERLKIKKEYNKEDSSEKKLGIILDVETTGLDVKEDKVIELAMILFEFNKDGHIFKIIEEYSEFEDPGENLNDEIIALTGINDEMVKGKKIIDEDVNTIVEKASLVIAHNASFDRKMIERRLPVFKKIYWACSASQIDWKAEGIPGKKLEYIAYSFKFFYDSHRALTDCYATLDILNKVLPKSNTKALTQLLRKARMKDYKIRAVGAPFDKKDMLKTRRYSWDGSNKVWFKDVPEDLIEVEKKYLIEEIYGTKKEIPVLENKLVDRFSVRS